MSSESLYRDLCEIYPVSRETFQKLEIYVDQLKKWQKKTNLIANSTVDDIWHRHVADSLQSVAIRPEARKWVDIGSGGGFPGLVIAACMSEHANSSVTLVESNSKKTAFLRQASRQMGANAKVITARIEDAVGDVVSPEIVTARALSSLSNLLELSSHWLMNGATALFHKGREYEQEIRETDGLWTFDLVNHESRISADSVVLEISNLKRQT
ncbi:MAG: 16S rRNA (guanine(527)-N(7))-methyltransferase RsmG [Pseudomonadota bacterium]